MAMSDPFEPWVPEVGQHVRVRVSLECLYCCDPRFTACYERAVADDGRTGTVYEVGHPDPCFVCFGEDEPDRAHMAHHVWVKWDERREYDDPPVRIGTWEIPFDAVFAPCELEPIA